MGSMYGGPVQTCGTAGARAEMRRFGFTVLIQPKQQVRGGWPTLDGLAAIQVLPRFQIARLQQGRCESRQTWYSAFIPGHHQPCKTRMQWFLEHGSAHRCQRTA